MKLATVLFAAVSVPFFVFAAEAKVLREGAVSNGYYWQLIERQDGSTRWLCRKIHEGKFQRHVACQEANAKRP